MDFYFEIVTFKIDEQAWIAAYRAENQKYFEAVLTNQKLDEIEKEETNKEQKVVPKRRILKKLNFLEEDTARNPHALDGFYLVRKQIFYIGVNLTTNGQLQIIRNFPV